MQKLITIVLRLSGLVTFIIIGLFIFQLYNKPETTRELVQLSVMGAGSGIVAYLAVDTLVSTRLQERFLLKKGSRSGIDTREDYYKSLVNKRFYSLSIAHPKFLSKRFESVFLVEWYFEELRVSVAKRIQKVLGESYVEQYYSTRLKLGDVVSVRLHSPDISFPDPVIKKLDSNSCEIILLAKPLESCFPGQHNVVLSISDNQTGVEYVSVLFKVNVVDFAFDHVSRPLFSKVSAIVLGISSFAMFILAFLEQIDKTVGLTSGTAAGVLATLVYTNFYNLYQRIRPNTP